MSELPRAICNDDGDFWACPGWVTGRTLLKHVFSEYPGERENLLDAYDLPSVAALQREMVVTHGYMRPMTPDEAEQSGYAVGEGWCWTQAGDVGAAKFTWMEG